MGREMVERGACCWGLLLALACGETTSNPSDAVEPSTTTNTGTDTGGASASSSSEGTVAAGDTTGSTTPAGEFPVGELPWFVSESGSGMELPKVSTEDGRSDVLHLSLGEPAFVDINTHMHQMHFGEYSRVLFEARASVELELTVSITSLEASDFWEDASAGVAWQGATVAVGTTWQVYDIELADMMPLSDGDPVPLGDDWGSSIRFLVEASEPLELWIDDVSLVGDGG